MGMKGSLAGRPNPVCSAITRHINTPTAIHGDSTALVIITTAIEGVPLIGSAAVQLDHQEVGTPGIGVKRSLAGRPNPVCNASTGHINTPAAIHSNSIALVIITTAIEGVPLIGSAAVQLDHREIGIPGIGMKRSLAGWPSPACSATAGYVNAPTAIHSNTIARVKAAATIEGVPLIGSAAVQLDHQEVVIPGIGMKRSLAGWPNPVCGAMTGHINTPTAIQS